MFAGHVGVALAATQQRPDIPLAALVAASLAPNVLVFPIFHTVPAVAVMLVAATAAGRVLWDRAAGVLLAVLVVSHFATDLITSELLIWPNRETEVGLRIYDVPVIDFALEAAVILIGWSLWRRAIDAPARHARTMVLVLLGSQAVFAAFVAPGANG